MNLLIDYLIIEKEAVHEALENHDQPTQYAIIAECGVWDSYYLVSAKHRSLGEVSSFPSNLVSLGVKSRFLDTWVSKSTYDEIGVGFSAGEVYSDELSGHDRLFNAILAGKIQIPITYESRRIYYYWTMCDNALEAKSLTWDLSRKNQILSNADLLIEIDEIRPSLLDIFQDSLRENTLQDLMDADQSLEGIEKRAEDFFYNVLGTLIIRSGAYYDFEEIKEFILTNFTQKEEKIEKD